MLYAFRKSDFVGQSICWMLIIASVAVWVIMIEKGYSMSKAMKNSQAFLRAFREKRNPLGLKDKAEETQSPAAAVYLAACERIDSFRLELEGGGRRAMSDDELEVMRSAMNLAVEDQLVILEKRTMVLATAVSGSPFLGLFGTVWGITVAFTQLAQAGRADVQTLAPGVSGALLTTVIALLVALPSMVGYNIITSKIKNFTVHLDNFVDEVYAKFKIEQLDSYRASMDNQQ
jgi:biopolymer transport protein TolQ